MRELDFLLLESVILEPENLCSFCSDIKRPKSEIAIAAYELFLKGYLFARIIYCEIPKTNNRRAYRRQRHLFKRRRTIIEVAIPSLENICKSLDGRLTILYSLTLEGGQYLEQEASINWSLFFVHEKNFFSIPLEWWNLIFKKKQINLAQKRNINIVYSQDKAILESWISCQQTTILSESLKWDILRNQKILYWKEVAEIHIGSFLYKSRDRTYPKDLAWYTIPAFESYPPSKLLSNYFEYYYLDVLDRSLEWKIEYTILKLGILYMEKYQYPMDLYWGNYFDGMTQAKTLISLTSMFERRFIQGTILDWVIPKICSTETVASKVFLNKVGVQSVLDYQLMAKYSVTKSGVKYCQFLEKTHQNLPELKIEM